MIIVYASPIDGSLKALTRPEYTVDEWDRAKRTIAGLDTAVWMFADRAAAEAFSDAIDFLADDSE
jgi:hypothetical protein